MKEHNKPKVIKIFGLSFVKIVSLLRKGILREIFVANHLASTDNLIATTKRQNTYKRKLALTQSGPNK